MLRQQYRILFHLKGAGAGSCRGRRSSRRSGVEKGDDGDMYVSADVKQERLVTHYYTGMDIGTVEGGRGAEPLAEDQRGLPTHMQSFMTDPAGLFRKEAPMVELVG